MLMHPFFLKFLFVHYVTQIDSSISIKCCDSVESVRATLCVPYCVHVGGLEGLVIIQL